MKMSYAWSIPNKWTFQMKPILNFITPHIYRAKNILVPFAGEFRFNHSDVTYIDLHKYPRVIQGDAREILPTLKDKYDLIISDPPYTFFQAVHSYGNKKLQDITFMKQHYDRLLVPGGKIIHCGFNSTGMGKKRNYKKLHLLVVACGGSHNDYLILLEQKINQKTLF